MVVVEMERAGFDWVCNQRNTKAMRTAPRALGGAKDGVGSHGLWDGDEERSSL